MLWLPACLLGACRVACAAMDWDCLGANVQGSGETGALDVVGTLQLHMLNRPRLAGTHGMQRGGWDARSRSPTPTPRT